MHGIAVLLAAAATGLVVARWLRLPGLPLLLLAGVALSLVQPPPASVLGDVLVLGVAFLLFVAGLELDPRRVRAARRAALRVGLGQFVLLAALTFAASRALGFDGRAAAHIALALAASSTLVGVRLLQRRQQMFEPLGRLVLGVLLLQDVLLVLAVPLVVEWSSGWERVLAATAGVLLLGALALAVRRWLGPLLVRHSDAEERLLLGSLSVLFLFLGLADLLDLPIVVGAFLAGAALARFPVNGLVRPELAPVGHFFTAIFFTALGALVGVPGPEELIAAAGLTLLLLVVTTPLVAAVAERSGYSARSAIEAGLLLSQASEFSLVLGLTGMMQGTLGPDAFAVIALVTMVTMLLTPVIASDRVARRLVALHPFRRRTPPLTPPRGHVLLLGAGSTGMPLLEELLVAGRAAVVVDDDPAVIERVAAAGVPVLWGDASEPDLLRRAGAPAARIVASSLRRPRDNGALLELARGVPVVVRVSDDAEADWVRRRGGIPVLTADAALESLLAWIDASEERLTASVRERTATA